ncbi:MAG TPA: RNA methyltransferase [Hyphomicrobiaceae bacterium]|nr:RNA methyltransferase [Hyphomicrobiaceae bacterium]
MKRPSEAIRGGPRAITSLQNERVKLIRSLHMRKARRETGLFVAEGASLLVTARDTGWKPKMLAFLAGSTGAGVGRDLLQWAEGAGADCLEVSQAVLGKLAARENPQTILGVFEQVWTPLPPPSAVADDALWIGLEAVRDPGNLGTIIRTADAAGGSGIVLIGHCVDPYSREAVRATMGSIFNVPLARVSLQDGLPWVQRWRGDRIGAHLGASDDFRAVAYRLPTLLLMGSEGPGLSPELSAACTRRVRIPMSGKIDSLNLAVATALMVYEMRRERLKL